MAYYGGALAPRPPRALPTGRNFRGDPGFLSFLGGIGKAAAGFLGIPTVAKTGAAGVQQIGGLLGTVLGKLTPTAPAASTVAKVIKASAPAAAGVAAGALMGAGGTAAATAMMGGGRRSGRRMNVTNVKALRRSVRRCQGFAKLAKRVLRFTSPKPVRGRPVFKRRSKKRSI